MQKNNNNTYKIFPEKWLSKKVLSKNSFYPNRTGNHYQAENKRFHHDGNRSCTFICAVEQVIQHKTKANQEYYKLEWCQNALDQSPFCAVPPYSFFFVI